MSPTPVWLLPILVTSLETLSFSFTNSSCVDHDIHKMHKSLDCFPCRCWWSPPAPHLLLVFLLKKWILLNTAIQTLTSGQRLTYTPPHVSSQKRAKCQKLVLDKPHNEWVRGFLDYELWDGKSSFVPTFCLAYRQTQWTQIIHQSNYHCLPEVGLGVMQPTHTFQRPRHILRRRVLWRSSTASLTANIFVFPGE